MAEQQEPVLLRETSDGIATLTLNRPRQRNALSMALIGELNAALADIAGDADVKIVIIRSNGPAFCADMTSKRCVRMIVKRRTTGPLRNAPG